MRKTMNKYLSGGAICSLLLLAAIFFLIPASVKAGVVQPSGEKYSNADTWNIIEELGRSGSVTLVSGKTYYMGFAVPLSNGDKIDATGATIYCAKGIAANLPKTTGYASLKNVTLKGGTWKSLYSGGISGSGIKLAHASNVMIDRMNLQVCNYEDHSIELVACKNITISGCTITGVGSRKKNSIEEQIQMDIASPRTAAYLRELSGFRTSFWNGAPCVNIKILKNKITGNRGVCANYSKDSAAKYRKKFHKNIVLMNNTILGKSAEGVALFNTMSCTVAGNKITCKSSRTGTAYSVGCHIAQMYKGPAGLKKGKIIVRKNVIRGGRQALNFETHKGTKYGTVIVKNNKLFCKKGAKNALHINKSKTARKYKEAGNKMKKW